MKEAQENTPTSNSGDPAAEVWAMYDADRIPTGTTMTRGEEFRPGELHMVVTVCIFGADGRMLIQRRADDKAGWPGLWDFTTGGSVTAGESSRAGAEREVFEELGIRLDLTGVRPSFTFNFRHGFDDVYLLRAGDNAGDNAGNNAGADLPPVDLATLAIPNAEVAEAAWATREEIHELNRRGKFIPYRASAIDFVFDMVGRSDIMDLAEQGSRPGTGPAGFWGQGNSARSENDAKNP